MTRSVAKRSPPKPFYRVVEDHLLEQIDSGRLVPGDLIPSEPQLAKLLGVSQGTVKKAIDNLVWQRRLYRHQGKGTYVSRIDFNNSLFRFFSYGDAEGRGIRIHKETPVRRLERGGGEVCARLGVPTGTKVLFIERMGYEKDTPVLVEHSHWRAEFVPGLENEDVHIPDLLYALIVEKYNLPVVRAEETLTADAADEETAQKLCVDPGTPIVVLKRVTHTTNDRIVEVRTTKGRADRFSYKTEIR
ncbi:MAG: GntR family transcriptional regulator [Gammaproteobacteria bacterium]|nr:GntR family transcriptional regulator [Gammaproteobacteria bacterium]NIR82519.1 GntR family transcriptional regulator [Gammaproteobacteria bacterium]NIU03650.1 GntR family transcriptional regulator [Gammaproteobacteria bacterium]NIX84924.1 UTRA domain-containing protein [Gammaproteobacteria bacterium]